MMLMVTFYSGYYPVGSPAHRAARLLADQCDDEGVGGDDDDGVGDDLLLQATLHNRLPSDILDSSSRYPGYESYPPWLLQLLSLDQDTRVCMLKFGETRVVYLNDSIYGWLQIFDNRSHQIQHQAQIPQMQVLARLPKRDSPGLATRQAGSKVNKSDTKES